MVTRSSRGARGAPRAPAEVAAAREYLGWTATNQLRYDLTLHCLKLDLPFHYARTPGVLIERVGPATPASKAGIRGGTTDVVLAGESYSLGGDVLVAIGGERVASLSQLRDVHRRRSILLEEVRAHGLGNPVGVGLAEPGAEASADASENVAA